MATTTATSATTNSVIDVNSIVSQLMAVESQPLDTYDAKSAAISAKQTALGQLSTAVSAFQGSLTTLSSASSFNTVAATSSNNSVVAGTATSTASAGIYNISVSQLATAQSLTSTGTSSTSTAIGTGDTTTISFQFGTVSAGSFGLAGTTLSSSVVANGVTTGSLSLNGTVITTDASTNSAKALAAAINAQSTTTGVSASVEKTATSATLFAGFGNVSTAADSSYTLSVGGITLGTQAAGVTAGGTGGVTAASVDEELTGTTATTTALAAANITFTGSAAAGTLQFFKADGTNLNVSEVVEGTVAGGIGNSAENFGSTTTAAGGVQLISAAATPITVAGNDPTLAGFKAGSGGAYIGSTFTQDGSQVTGSVTIDSSNNTLAGIRDAINKANLGVTASIISDGTDVPNHLVLTSTKTGASSTMKISLSGTSTGSADPTLAAMLAYDPAGTQAMKQSTAAKSTKLTVNGIDIVSASNSVTGAIAGVTLSVGAVGSTSMVVAKDSSTIKSSVDAFVKAYNTLNTAIKSLTAYDSTTGSSGALQGNATALSVQTQIRRALTSSVTGLTGDLTSLSQIGISFQKDGSLTLDSTKLQTAITDNFDEIGSLFAAVGTASDTLVTFKSGGTKAVPGTYALDITALASQGTLKSTAALGASTTIANDTTWSVSLNQTDPTTAARTATVSIPAGTYTQAQLATLLQTTINGTSSFVTNKDTVVASVDTDGILSISSARYGSTSNIAISSMTGTAPETLFGTATPEKGVDVAGTLGGVLFTGSGQTLTGGAGSPTDGLKFDVTGGAVGARGTISFAQGYAYTLNSLATGFVGTDGMITGSVETLASNLEQIADQRAKFAETLTTKEARYRAQYSALDVSLSSMNSTSTFLTQQLASIAANS
jgi:flagellar hook-associated protein 2